MILPAGLATLDVCDLTTQGRVTGRAHRIEIWFAHHVGTLFFLSGGGDRSDWVRNLIHHPAVTVDLGGTRLPGRGRLVTAAAEARIARDLVFAKYQPGYPADLSRWREEALPIAVDLGTGPPTATLPGLTNLT